MPQKVIVDVCSGVKEEDESHGIFSSLPSGPSITD